MEGRRHKRLHVQVGCWIVGEDNIGFCCSSFDISDSGISICVEDPLPTGKNVTLQFYTPASAAALSIPAEVIWSRTEPDGAMGLRFVDISGEQMATLRELARQLQQREFRNNHHQR
ncbi:MAG: PilZ domain-containing protein [Geobacter sp.]|nr:PilZ domain-containing protein [Geobacter sp.]